MQSTGIDLLLKAIDVSLDRSKLALAVLGLVAAGVIGGIFFGLAMTVDNVVAVALLALLGLIAVWVITTLFTGAISKMSYESLAGRPPLDVGDALRYAASHLTSLLFAPLLLAAMILAVYIAEAIVLLLGRIPTAGPILSSLLFLPLVLVNMFLLAFVFFGAWLVPAIVAGEGTGVMETVSRLRTIVRQAPGRIATYWVVTVLLTVILGLVLLTVMSVATTQTQVLSTVIASGGSPSALTDPLSLFGGFGLDTGIAGLLYLLALLLLSAVVVAIPYFIFPLACACATHISVAGGAPAAIPVAQPVPVSPPAQMPAPAVTPAAPPTPAPPPVHAPAPPAPAAPSYCKQCGGPLRPGARFCGQCRAPVS